MERLKLDIEKRDIYDDPLTESEIRSILRLAKITPRQLLRKKDKMYKELKLDDRHTDAEIIKYMAQHPGLIMRPIVFGKNQILMGKAALDSLKTERE
jgi:arsenate reductase